MDLTPFQKKSQLIFGILIKKIENLSNDQITNNENNNESIINESDIFSMQAQKENDIVETDQVINSKNMKIIGLIDPEDYDLKIDMWVNSNGDQLKYLFTNISELNLSDDAAELMNILLLTNSYHPEKNITQEEFLKIKSDWLIKNNDQKLIEEYLLKNQILDIQPRLSRYLIDQYLSSSNIGTCKIFLTMKNQLQMCIYQNLIFIVWLMRERLRKLN